MSAHSLGRASSVLRSKRLKDGKRHTARGTEKDALRKVLKGGLKKGPVLGESGPSSTIIIHDLATWLKSREERSTCVAVARHVTRQ